MRPRGRGGRWPAATLSAGTRALPNWVRVRQAVGSSSQFLTLASPTRRIGKAEVSAFNPSELAVTLGCVVVFKPSFSTRRF